MPLGKPAGTSKHDFVYLMISHWEKHWDELGESPTKYPFSMLRKDMDTSKLIEGTPTIFIRLKGTKNSKRPTKAWKGWIYDIKIDKEKQLVWFKVEIEEEVPIPEKYKDLKEGWYLVKEMPEEVRAIRSFDPPFFEILLKTENWQKFENYTFYLLKLLGIHEIVRFEKQKGQPDGFFKIGNLAVIYDTTLDPTFRDSKGSQIENYIAQLEKEVIKYGKREISFIRSKKQVWIITRGSSQLIKKKDDIQVKEVPISKIMRIYRERLLQNLSKEQVEGRLRNI